MEDNIDNNEEKWSIAMHEKYKRFFAIYEGEVTERSYYQKGQILRGIECGQGWKWIIERFLESLEWIEKNRTYDTNPNFDKDAPYGNGNTPSYEVGPPTIKIFQIKEKFGRLSIYIEEMSDRVRRDVECAIAKAEARAELTCKYCGKLEKDMKPTKGWVLYICEECHERTGK